MDDAFPRIYLAGPDLFFRDAAARYGALKALCAAHGLQGVAPTDGPAPPEHLAGRARAEHLYRQCLQHLHGCDAVLAHLAPFRGAVEPDSGTVFEIGVAVALGRPVALWAPQLARSLRERVAGALGAVEDATGTVRDAACGAQVEDFGLPLNLMLAVPCAPHASAREAVAWLAGRLLRGGGAAAAPAR